MIPMSGRPTPVTINPIIAGIKLLPLNWPTVGGNIKFPAPKNRANNINPINNVLFDIQILY